MKCIFRSSIQYAIVGILTLSSASTLSASPTKVALEPTEKSIQFFKKQVSGSKSITNAINSLLDRYPHRTTEFVSIALSAYPEHYKEIIMASVKKQPMFVDEIIIVANDFQITEPTEILEIAITAEPSYAGAATRAACNYSPDAFKEIIRVAVSTEPDSADQIAQKLVKAFPSKTMEILVTTIKEVPYVGKYVLDALLATAGEDKGASKDIIVVSIEQLAKYPDALDRLVELAKQRDIDSATIKKSAIQGGLSQQEISSIIEKYYN